MTVEEALGLVEEVKNCSLPWDDAHWEAFDIVINYVKDKLNNSDKSISEFDIQPQPKQEWSEEDNAMLISIENILIGRGHSFHDKEINWLKSLRPQSQWKPNEEQIEAIKDTIEFLGCTKKVREDLKSLYEQLLKLREE